MVTGLSLLPNSFWYFNFLRISCYTTASTDESVFIIGGYTKGTPDVTSRIAEYKNGKWIDGGNLAQARYGHGAITSESKTLIIGGTHNDGTKYVLVHEFLVELIENQVFDQLT